VTRAKHNIMAAQDRMKAYVNAGRREVTFTPGQLVLLSSVNIKLKHPGARKLLPKYMGPFKVVDMVGPAAVKLALPPEWKRLHPVFHVSLVKPFLADGNYQPPPLPQLIDDELEYEVEVLLDHRLSGRNKRLEYLVKWAGYGHEHNTWEPKANLVNCSDLLKEFTSTHDTLMIDA